MLASAGHTSTSSEEILQILQSTFLEGMVKWRSHAVSSTSPLAAYYNLGAFSQSVRLGLTNATYQYRNVLCRLNSWLTMLFPLGTWSSLCISHNELLKIHRDCTNEVNTLNYTVTLGPFTGGGLLLESESGEHSHFVAEVNRNLRFALVDTRDQPLAFDGTLWHGTAPFQGDRWVITAYTCRNLEKLREADVQALHAWGFPLPQSVASSTAEVASPQPAVSQSIPSKFCLWLGEIVQGDKDQLSQQSVPLIAIPDLQDDTSRHQIIRCSADGVFSTIFIKFSDKVECIAQYLGVATLQAWHFHVARLCTWIYLTGIIAGTILFSFTVLLQVSGILCKSHLVHFRARQVCPWIMVSSSEAFASLGEVCSCKRCLHCPGATPYPSNLIEAFGKFFISAEGATCVPGESFSVKHAWDSIPGKSVDEPPHAWVDGGGLHSRPDWSGKERVGIDVMRGLRHSLMEFCGRCHLPSRLRSRLLSPKEEGFLAKEDIANVQAIFGAWLQEQTGNSVDWSIPQDQPYCLHALSALSSALQDCDISLFGALLQGVPTGFKQDIPLSGCFAPSWALCGGRFPVHCYGKLAGG